MPLQERRGIADRVARHSQNSRHGEEAVNRAGISRALPPNFCA